VLREHIVSIISYVAALSLSLGIILFEGFKYESFIIAFLIMILTFLFETRIHLLKIQVTPKLFAKVSDLSPHMNKFTRAVLEIWINSFEAYGNSLRADGLGHRELRKVLERHIEEVKKELRDCAEGTHRTRAYANNKENYAINLCKRNYRAVSVGQIAGYWQTAEGENVMKYCEQAIKKKVKVERIFICDKSHLSGLKKVIEDNQKIGVEVSYLDEATLGHELTRRDFGIVDKGHVAVELLFDSSHNRVNETCFYYDSTDRSKGEITDLEKIWHDLRENPNRMEYKEIPWPQENMS
jgi:hypothetical protein